MKHHLAVLLVGAVACGGNQNVGPVAGSHEAFERHYPVTVVEAHAALIEVLTEKYGGVVSDDGRHVVATAACRDTDGDRCAEFPFDANRPVGYIGPGNATATAGGRVGASTTVGHYWFQVYAGVVGTDGAVQIQLGGQAKDFKDHEFPIGGPDSPAWMPHEVDEVRVAVDHELASTNR